MKQFYLGEILVVILNNRKQSFLKKGDEFMLEKDRMEIVYLDLDMVDEVLLSGDEDASVCTIIRNGSTI